jgi:hypothetical protein
MYFAYTPTTTFDKSNDVSDVTGQLSHTTRHRHLFVLFRCFLFFVFWKMGKKQVETKRKQHVICPSCVYALMRMFRYTIDIGEILPSPSDSFLLLVLKAKIVATPVFSGF